MSSLINQKIKDTYEGLIKTSDEQPVDGTLKNLEDGNGGVLPIQISSSTVNFTGTVTGIDTGGMVAGAGADSIKSADTLTTNAASAAGPQSIALGDGASTANTDQIAIGKNAVANQLVGAIAIGANTIAAGAGKLAIGNNANAGNGMAIGPDTDGGVGRSLAVGISAQGTGNESCAVGGQANATGSNSTALGDSADATTTGAIAVGNNTTANATGAVALGKDVTASIADTVSVKALEVQTDSTASAGGILMSDAGGTDRRINIDATGKLYIDNTAVSGGGGGGGIVSFELPQFTVPNSAAADTCYAVVTIPANTFTTGDILEFRSYENRDTLNNTCYESYWFSEQSQTVGQPVVGDASAKQQAGLQSSSNGVTYYQKTLFIGATGTAVYVYGVPNETGNETIRSGDPVEIQTIDWTQDIYFYFQAWNDSTTGSVTNYGTILRKIN
jgi:hypothetical protein